MEKSTNKPFAGLPEESFYQDAVTGKTIKIKRGESGFYRLPNVCATADELNDLFHITKAQAEAMSVGSMFGWHAPGADPRRYREDGTPLTQKEYESIEHKPS